MLEAIHKELEARTKGVVDRFLPGEDVEQVKVLEVRMSGRVQESKASALR